MLDEIFNNFLFIFQVVAVILALCDFAAADGMIILYLEIQLLTCMPSYTFIDCSLI